MNSQQLDPVRRRAGELLLRWRRGEATIEALLERAQADDVRRGRELNADARRRLRELLLGSMHLLARYEFALALRSQRQRRAPDAAWASLVLGMHELFAMRTPDHAAVAQSVLLCRRLGAPESSGFVNAVLRRVQREGLASGFPDRASEPIAYASTWLSHPRWMVERWAAALGIEAMLALCECNNARRPLCVRAPPQQREAILEAMRRREWSARASSIACDGIVVDPGVPAPLLLQEFGSLVVQDEAAQLVAPLLAATRPQRVLDLCAAPGGKTTHVRALLPHARIVACDRSWRRLLRLRATLRRLGDAETELVQGDGAEPPLAVGWPDAVLLDAPCTGSGVFARRHDARWRRSPAQLRFAVQLQRRLLQTALTLVRPGGVVVYATCSLEPEENDEVVDAVLAQRPDVEEWGLRDELPADLLRGERLAIWPQRHGCDGAFAVRLRRRAC